MIRKIWIFFFLTALTKTGYGYRENDPGQFPKFSNFIFDMIDKPLAIASEAAHGSLNLASNIVQAVPGGSFTNGIFDFAHQITEGTIEGARGVFQSLKDAQDRINHGMSGAYNNLLACRKKYLSELNDVRENLLQNALRNAHGFLEEASKAAQVQVEYALNLGYETCKKTSVLAKDLIEESHGDNENLQELSKKLEKFTRQYSKAKEELSARLSEFIERLDSEVCEETSLGDFFEQFILILHDGADMASQAKTNVEEILAAGKKALGRWPENFIPKIKHIKEILHELYEKPVIYTNELIATGRERINDVAKSSKGVFNSFLETIEKILKNSATYLKNIFNSTASMVGDFFNSEKLHSGDSESESLEEPLLFDVDDNSINSMGDDLTNIADNFDEEMKFSNSGEESGFGTNLHYNSNESYVSSELENTDVILINLGCEDIEKIKAAFSELIKKIKEVAENGRITIRNLFDKRLTAYEKSKDKINFSISGHMNFIQENISNMTQFLQDIIQSIATHIREAQRRFGDWISQALGKIKRGVNNRVDEISKEIKQKTPDARELYGKIQYNLENLKAHAQEQLDDYKTQTNYKVYEAIEQAKCNAAKVKRLIEKRFYGGSKKVKVCAQKHNDRMSQLISKISKEVSSCGTQGLKELTRAFSKSLELQGHLSEKMERIKQEYRRCRRNSSGLFGRSSCLGKVSHNEFLGISKASADISNATKSANRNVAICTQDKVQRNQYRFNEILEEIEQCMTY